MSRVQRSDRRDRRDDTRTELDTRDRRGGQNDDHYSTRDHQDVDDYVDYDPDYDRGRRSPSPSVFTRASITNRRRPHIEPHQRMQRGRARIYDASDASDALDASEELSPRYENIAKTTPSREPTRQLERDRDDDDGRSSRTHYEYKKRRSPSPSRRSMRVARDPTLDRVSGIDRVGETHKVDSADRLIEALQARERERLKAIIQSKQSPYASDPRQASLPSQEVASPSSMASTVAVASTAPSGQTTLTHANGSIRIAKYVLQTCTDDGSKLGSIRSLFHIKDLLSPGDPDPEIHHPIVFDERTAVTVKLTLDYRSVPAIGPDAAKHPDVPIVGRETFTIFCVPVHKVNDEGQHIIIPHCIIQGKSTSTTTGTTASGGGGGGTARSVIERNSVYLEAESFPNSVITEHREVTNVLSLKRSDASTAGAGSAAIARVRYLNFRCGIEGVAGETSEYSHFLRDVMPASVNVRYAITAVAKVKFVQQ